MIGALVERNYIIAIAINNLKVGLKQKEPQNCCGSQMII